MKKEKPRVIIGLSGGVDSSVAAFLLKEKLNLDVIGVFIKFWQEKENKLQNPCCSLEAQLRAQQTAALLGIRFLIVDSQKLFKQKVVDYFLKEEKRGLTPNPCVVCNRDVKFSVLLEQAKIFKAKFVATGHYARIISNKEGSFIFRARDLKKDQSYFLWMLKKPVLKKIIFPLGEFTKEEVRKIAQKAKLPTQSIQESQELCFVGNSKNDFLARHLKLKPGKIVDLRGKELGEHQGVIRFTIGQRKGLKLSGGPWYVVKIDIKKNIVYVSRKKEDVLKKQIKLTNTNWFVEPSILLKKTIWGKIRYKAPLSSCIIERKNGSYRAIFKNNQFAPTPGQSAVFYDKSGRLLGGGIIDF